MIQKILNRPVLATVISIIIVILGLMGLMSLPITSYPEIAPPLVQVTANYPGANAEVVLKSVIAPLEEQINGVEGMTYMVSTAGNDGSATIKVYFELGYNADMAAVNVQNRVSAASSKLPSAVTSYGITTEKMQNTMLMTLSVYTETSDFNSTFVENYTRINIVPELQRVHGVGRVEVYGAGDYSIKIWLDPVKMASLNLVPSDIAAAIQEQNVESAPGKFGQDSETAFEYTIKYTGKYVEPSEYEEIVIKAYPDGRILKLKDVAKVDLSAFTTSVSSTANGNPAVEFAIYQMAGSNAREVVNTIEQTMERLSQDFPEGIEWVAAYNANSYLNASIKQVIKTLLEAFVLVFLVVLVFLQDLRSTIIPCISALVALVGTFFCLQMFGFSINMLTLFALVLAIGIVVDDAIVVVEAVHAKLGSDKTMTAHTATSQAMSEITSAIISISLVMSAVFVPVSFMTGPSGAFYTQFALTLASAVIISAINALTLSPVMCIMLVRRHDENGKKLSLIKRAGLAFNTAFESFTDKYTSLLSKLADRKIIAVSTLCIAAVLMVWLMGRTPSAFIPNEDVGAIMVDVSMPAGTSLDRTKKVMSELDSIASTVEGVQERSVVSGVSILNNTLSGSYGMMILKLKDWQERDVSDQEIIAQLREKSSHIKDGTIIFFVPPTVPGFGISSGFEMQLQDKTGASNAKFFEVQQDFLNELMKRPEIMYAQSGFNMNFPQYQFNVNVDRCKMAGVQVSDVFSALQAYFGSTIVSDFNRFTKYYRVVMHASPEYRKDINAVNAIYVRNNLGNMVPISALVDFSRVYGPESLNRYNLFTAATITGAPADGYSTGEAIEAIREVAQTLPQGYGYDFSGMTREEVNSSGQQLLILLLCFVFVFLILSAQYNSYILPWSVMLPLVIGMAGVFIFINIVGISNNIYVQVAMIMLIGLLAKNGILIVEYAKQRFESGMSIKDAAVSGAKARLRPILMTSFAFIFGLLPLCFSTGAGAIGNRSIGVAAAGGMFVGTLFGVFVIPVMYIIFQNLDLVTKGGKHNKHEQEAIDSAEEELTIG